MNSIETTSRFERKFDQDRVENKPVSSPPRPLNILRTTKSAPVSSVPRASLLFRSPTSLLTATVDHGLMDMSVDDGTNGNIDDTVRLLRFSTAASAIDGLFHSPQRNSQGSNPFKTEKPTCAPPAPANQPRLSPQAPGKMAVTSETPKKNAEKPVHTDGNSQSPKKASDTTENVNVARKEAARMIKKQPDILETEPLTPPRADGTKLGEETDSSETPSPAKEASLQHATSRSLGQAHDSKNAAGPAGSANKTDPAQEAAPPVKRRLSAFFSTNDETPDVGTAPQSSGIQQGFRGTKRDSKLQLMNIFKRSSVGAVRTPPQPAIDSANSQNIKEQPDERRTEKVLPVFNPKSLPAPGTETEQLPVTVNGKKLSDEGKEDGAHDAEAAESLNAVSSDGQAPPSGGERPKILNFFKRRSTVERPAPVGVESGSGQNTLGSNEQNELATNKGPRKLVMLVKKLSSGFRDKAGGERKTATRPAGKASVSTAMGATASPEGKAHSGTPDGYERPADEGERSEALAQQPASSGRSRNATLEQPTESTPGEQARFTKGDRQLLLRLLKGFSASSKDRASKSNAESQGEVGQEAPNKGIFFAKLFRRKSTNAEEKESETGNTPCPEDAGDRPSPPESQTRWGELSQKVTRFLGMLVH